MNCMQCPSCSNTLTPTPANGITIDICPSCYGIWFDDKEITPVIKHLSTLQSITPPRPSLFQSKTPRSTNDLTEDRHPCPKCTVTMSKFNYAYDSNIFLDKCPNCDGIWADGGEVRLLAQHMKSDPRIEKIATALITEDAALNGISKLEKNLSKRGYYGMPLIILPINDENLTEKTPVATFSLMGLCSLILLAEVLFVSDPGPLFQQFGFLASDFWRLGTLSSLFLHAGFLHLLGNMFFLWMFGDNIEERLGAGKFLAFFVLCGLAGNIAHMIAYPGSSMPAIGASGAVSGVMGAYLVFYPKVSMRMFIINGIYRVPMWIYLGGWGLLQLLYGTVLYGTAHIGFWAHAGGFAFGASWAGVIKRRHP